MAFLNLNYNRIYQSGDKKPLDLNDHHRPYFLASSDDARDGRALEEKRQALIKRVDRAKRNPLESQTLRKVVDIGEVEEYLSFTHFGTKRNVFKVYTQRPGDVPAVSNHLFLNSNLSSYEFDVPYEQRALIDLAAEERFWVYETRGQSEKLKVLAYDIETFDFTSKDTTTPINIIGFGDFQLTINSRKSLEDEDFEFEILEMEEDWKEKKVVQLEATNVEEEIRNILIFIEELKYYDIVTGHNLIDFDNQQVYNRVEHFLKNEADRLSKTETQAFREFLDVSAMRKDSFHFGRRQSGVQFYPATFDSFHATRRFYRFLESFTLKNVALFLGIVIPDRKYIDVTKGTKLSMDEWCRYNRHDVKEQLGVSMNLLPQALPLAFSTGMPLERVLPAGTTSIWDFMAMIRGARVKKIMPPIHRAVHAARSIHRNFGVCSKQDIVERVRGMGNLGELDKDLQRFAKYGEEMPDWVERPYSIFNLDAPPARDEYEERRLTSYSIPGGMTISPDKDANSHLLPWWNVVAADVGAMYPTILRGLNIGADTVRIAEKGEEPDDWIWVKRASPRFVSEVPHIELTPKGIADNPHLPPETIANTYGFADRGYLLGIKRHHEHGLINRAMAGIMQMIWKIKRELKTTKAKSPEHRRLSMMYQSIKGVRNAGTHGILIASGVSCRQFNVWGGAAITTKGQEILHDVMLSLQSKGMKVVYGDTDGIYIASSRDGTLLPELRSPLQQFLARQPAFLESLSEKKKELVQTFMAGDGKVVGDVPAGTTKAGWITPPEDILDTIQESNRRWREKLNYEDFELETELDTAMVFVKHKNYLIFNIEDGRLVILTKGNNFKGSDKAEIARTCLSGIMQKVLFSHLQWDGDEERTRKKFTQTIKKVTSKEIENLTMRNFNVEELTLIQRVSPPRTYKRNQDGSLASYGKRAAALERLLNHPITSSRKFKFVVTKNPLPGIDEPSKSGVKPIDYMYPVELVRMQDIDLEWYRDMVANYIKGAFGLKDLAESVQFSLTDFM